MISLNLPGLNKKPKKTKFMHTFNIPLSDNCNITGLNKYLDINSVDIEFEDIITMTTINIEPDFRTWGIKCIDIFITEITAEINWYVHNDDLTDSQIDKLIAAGGEFDGERITGKIKINSLEDWEIKNELEFRVTGHLSIDHIDIDLANKIITVS